MQILLVIKGYPKITSHYIMDDNLVFLIRIYELWPKFVDVSILNNNVTKPFTPQGHDFIYERFHLLYQLRMSPEVGVLVLSLGAGLFFGVAFFFGLSAFFEVSAFFGGLSTFFCLLWGEVEARGFLRFCAAFMMLI